MKKKEVSVNSQKENHLHPIEVETRAIVADERLDSIIERLKLLGSEHVSTEVIEDSHFCPQHITSFDEIAMNEVGSYGLRVRRVTNSSGSRSNINVKVLTRPNDHSSWRETETNVESWESIRQILQIIGFKSFFSVVKNRQTYQLNDLTIVIDHIPKFGTVIEVEKLVDDSKIDKAKKDTRNLLYQLGIAESDILTTSVPRLLMQLLSRF